MRLAYFVSQSSKSSIAILANLAWASIMKALLAGFTEAELAAVLKFFTTTNAVRPAEYMKPDAG